MRTIPAPGRQWGCVDYRGQPGPAHGPGRRLAMLSYSTEASGSGNEVDKVHEATALVCDRSRTCSWTG